MFSCDIYLGNIRTERLTSTSQSFHLNEFRNIAADLGTHISCWNTDNGDVNDCRAYDSTYGAFGFELEGIYDVRPDQLQ